MDHVAILRKARISKGDDLLGDILAGTKTIESRWYVNKIAPWNTVHSGDTLYLKESGCPITAKANVTYVLQYENLDEATVDEIILKYGKQIAPYTSYEDFKAWVGTQKTKKYCILVFLDKVSKVVPFEINKKGFGISAAWLVVGDINRVKL